jgi:aminoglycoside 3-N-acetyltransferase I
MTNIKIVKLAAGDLDKFTQLIKVFEDVFEMQHFEMPAKSHLQHMLEKKDFFVFVALADLEVVGGLTSYALQQYYSTSPLVYIYDLAVTTKHQRQGIGKSLIEAITAYCKGIGMEEVFVQADKVDEHAVAFYRSTGATEEQVLHFNYPLHKSKKA